MASEEPASRPASALPRLPEDALIILPVRNTVLFPGLVLPLTVGRKRSVAAAQAAARGDKPLGVLKQIDATSDTTSELDLHRVGTVAAILRYVTAQDGAHPVIVQGLERFRIIEFLPGYSFFVARIERILEQEELTPAIEARMHHLKREAAEAFELLPQAPAELASAIEATASGARLADVIAGFMDIKPDEKQQVLETLDVQARLEKVDALLAHRLAVLRLSQEIENQTQAAMDKRQREYILREQLKAIQQELGETEPRAAETEDLRKTLDDANLPPEAKEQVERELARLERLPEAAAEYTMIRSYLDWMLALPWSVESEENIDINTARTVLDEDHYGLERIKRRKMEYLAVRKLNPQGKSPILCFVGPPGVGKTSLGQSIARATGRKFMRIALGGVHDEAEIRGHRRTYVGALPGNIIQGIRKAGTRNPEFMLDEMDKLGAGFHGDTSAALLEVLDPEQNATFRDNYLAVPFDLSKVMFVGTANVLDNIPGPLRDRMEVIDLAGYTEDEKVEIARRYLLRRQLDANGLTAEQCTISDAALRAVVRDHTREAGVRQLEREIGRVFRAVTMRIAEGTATRVDLDVADIAPILGAPRFEAESAMRTAMPGVATGLAWTPGGGKLILTGQLGDVMKESAQAALSLIKSRADQLGLTLELFEKSDIHIHVPAGAIPKDGPSAGVAMFTALYSLLAGKSVKADVAMTGEISLRGLVLPVGGIKEKTIAAARAGIHTVCLPARNRRDFDEIPLAARDRLEFVWLETVDDVIAAAFEQCVPARATHTKPHSSGERHGLIHRGNCRGA